METLNYSAAQIPQISAARSAAVFIPGAVAIFVCVIYCYWFQENDTAGIALLAIFALAEVMTICLLLAWRRRLHLLTIIAGWIIAALGAIFLTIVVAVNLGLLTP